MSRVRSSGIDVTNDYKNKAHALPLPATLTMELGERISKSRPGAHVRLYSDYPFASRRDGGPRDDFEREAIAALRRAPDQPFHRFEEFGGRPSLRYAVADRMQASCVNCHNTHPESPKKDWKVGDMRGVLEFIRPLDNEVAEGQLARQYGLLSTIAMASLGLAGLAIMYFRLQRVAISLGTSESRARGVLDAALDCIITMDHKGNILEFNPAAEKLLGRSRQEVLGKQLSEVIIPAWGREAHKRGLRHFLATGEGPIFGKRIEVSALRVDGSEVPVELAISVIEQAGPPVFTAYLRDLTERKQKDAVVAQGIALFSSQSRHRSYSHGQ